MSSGAGVGLRLSHSRTPASVPCFHQVRHTPGRTPPAGGTSRTWPTVARIRVTCPMHVAVGARHACGQPKLPPPRGFLPRPDRPRCSVWSSWCPSWSSRHRVQYWYPLVGTMSADRQRFFPRYRTRSSSTAVMVGSTVQSAVSSAATRIRTAPGATFGSPPPSSRSTRARPGTARTLHRARQPTLKPDDSASPRFRTSSR